MMFDVDWRVHSEDFNLSRPGDCNSLLKTEEFWECLPAERVLLVQKDALLIEPVPESFMSFGYVGAPFLLRTII